MFKCTAGTTPTHPHTHTQKSAEIKWDLEPWEASEHQDCFHCEGLC